MCADLCAEIRTLTCRKPCDTHGPYKIRKNLRASDGSEHMYVLGSVHINLRTQITLWKMIEKIMR